MDKSSMKKLLLTLALLFAPTLAWGQCNGVFAAGTVCGSAAGGPPGPATFTSAFPLTIGGLVINAGTGNNSSLIINQTLTGGTGGNKNYTSLNIASDNVNCGFCTDYEDTHFFGGPLAAGTRIGAFYYMVQTAPTNPTQPGGNSLRVYLGNASVVQTNTGDGGTGTGEGTALGTYFGNNPVVRNSGTNIYNMFGSEMDLQSGAGSSARYSAGAAIVNFEAVQGTAVDAGALFYSGGSISAASGGGPWGPGIGFHNGILFAELASNGLVPIDSGGTVLGTYLSSLSNIPVTNGIDLRGFLVSGLAYASTGFSVDGSGNLISRMAAKSIKGNSAGSAGASSDLTVAQTQALLGYPMMLGGFLDGINCNATNTDNAITITSPTTNYRIFQVLLQNTGSTASLTTATFGVFSTTGGGGTTIVNSGSVMTTMTSNAVNGADMQAYSSATLGAFNFGTVQLRTQTAQGAACTINAYVYIQPLP